MNLSDYRTNQKLKEQGVWLEFDGAQFLIASQETAEYRRRMSKLGRKIPAVKAKKDPLIYDEPVIEIIADTILLDFRGVYDVTNGRREEVAPTRENKIKLLHILPFREFVAESSADINNFREEATAEDAEDLKSRGEVAS